MVSVDPFAYLFAALLVLVLPLKWLLGAIAAAVFHELCHMAMIRILGGQIHSIHIRMFGTVINTDIPGRKKEWLCALAGPVGSLSLLSLCHTFPPLALCAGVQGLFNLLPIYPLDGGRALSCILELTCPSHRETILFFTERLTKLIIFLAALPALKYSGFLLPLIAAMVLLQIRKSPCKRSRIGLQ